ncbi:hypothetical protein AC249_AIPGENE22350 [Exaiptasia diaphana]|nr:hypothetical protein AC249_AIPGENE22350 [Exaiptasia diaphana]
MVHEATVLYDDEGFIAGRYTRRVSRSVIKKYERIEFGAPDPCKNPCQPEVNSSLKVSIPKHHIAWTLK